jgi:SAM-dependent methyltransferase
VAKSLEAGDISPTILGRARHHYGMRVRLETYAADALPYADHSKDVLILFEAIYYLPDAERFVMEAMRVLRPGGDVLIATANKDLADFNPSPYSRRYYGIVELSELFAPRGFECQYFGHLAADAVSLRQRILRPIKRVVVRLGLMPKTMAGKRVLKRLVFGPQLPMPAELTHDMGVYNPPTALDGGRPDRRHKVIYCIATLRA